ncbi:MAG: DUF4172 domain-containing protein [Prevotellaceae bacterium]|jgi:Fic family protein|nr:DUF4172 domain-containing protein [Prevotellaceae bacterium]
MYFVYKRENCPELLWDNEALLNPLADVRFLQGLTIGKVQSLAFDLQNEALLEILTLDTLKCAEIENISLDEEKVRMSFACKFGFYKTKTDTNSDIDGIIEAITDAILNFNAPLTKRRLLFWYENLILKRGQEKDNSTNQSSKLARIKKVVYKAIGKEGASFKAMANRNISNFITWFNTENNLDSLVKAAIAHLWFITIQPFDEGNAQMAGIITNMLLARSDDTFCRFYSMHAQIKSDPKKYYSILKKTQNENFDITNWMLWFFGSMKKALKATDTVLANILKKSEFWKIHNKTPLNIRQRLVLNKLLSGTDFKLQSSTWAKIAGCSADTALRDIKDLIKKGILCRKSQGGRSTNYTFTNL